MRRQPPISQGSENRGRKNLPDYSEILIRVAQVQRSITDRLNANDVDGARALADELLFQARALQLVLKEAA